MNLAIGRPHTCYNIQSLITFEFVSNYVSADELLCEAGEKIEMKISRDGYIFTGNAIDLLLTVDESNIYLLIRSLRKVSTLVGKEVSCESFLYC